MKIRKLFAFAVLATMVAPPAMADMYSPTLSGKERARHEFRDVQREAYPRGPLPQQSVAVPRHVVPAAQNMLLGSPIPAKP
jgi:hypothetical protein